MWLGEQPQRSCSLDWGGCGGAEVEGDLTLGLGDAAGALTTGLPAVRLYTVTDAALHSPVFLQSRPCPACLRCSCFITVKASPPPAPPRAVPPPLFVGQPRVAVLNADVPSSVAWRGTRELGRVGSGSSLHHHI